MTGPLILGGLALAAVLIVVGLIRGSHPPPSDFYGENPYDWPQ